MPRDSKLNELSKRVSSRRVALISVVTAALSLQVCVADPGNDVPCVRSKTFDIEYHVNPGALPLDSVELWYTRDDGKSWQTFGLDEDRQSPFTFVAPEEGPYGFFIILTNSTGASSSQPKPGTPPQQSVFVDYTPPMVQLHPLKLVTSNGQRILEIHWTAVDSQFAARPIALSYRRLPDNVWTPIVLDPLANTGRYDWRIPDELKGAVAVQVVATDRGGNSTTGESESLEIPALSSTNFATAANPTPGPTVSASSTMLPGSKRAQDHVAKLLEEAMLFRDKGDYSESMSRLREVVRLDPMMTDAFAEMGMILHRMGDPQRAMDAYEIALKQRPTLRSALLGSALILKQRSDYSAAAERLRTILKYNANDAEVWLHLGDVAVYQGDEVYARECYTRAAQINPDAPIVADARKRLALMAETSRTYETTRRPVEAIPNESSRAKVASTK